MKMVVAGFLSIHRDSVRASKQDGVLDTIIIMALNSLATLTLFNLKFTNKARASPPNLECGTNDSDTTLKICRDVFTKSQARAADSILFAK